MCVLALTYAQHTRRHTHRQISMLEVIAWQVILEANAVVTSMPQLTVIFVRSYLPQAFSSALLSLSETDGAEHP